MQGLKPVKKIFYAGFSGLTKDGLSRETNTTFPHLKVSLKAFFSRNDFSKRKSFHPLARELDNECYVSISAEIICFEHLQQ